VAGDGTKYPLYEATHSYAITVYKSDCRRAEVGDPGQCLIALGAKRDRHVEAAYIGSGRDAYIIFKGTKLRAAHAMHFTINAQAARVRDYFETHKGATTQMIELSAVTNGRTLSARSKLNKARTARIKAGKHVPKKREKPQVTRIMRLGVKHRPKAVVKQGIVSLVEQTAA
jgi:hypothetical protein